MLMKIGGNMIAKILLVAMAILVALLVYVAFLPSQFRFSREVKVAAPAAVIFPHINNLAKFNAWNPWVKMDPAAKGEYSGPPEGIDASYRWEGGRQSGTGRMTIVEAQAPFVVRMRLDFQKPFAGTNIVDFTLRAEGSETVVTWAMTGKSSFLPRLMCTLLFINMEKMMNETFDRGLADLKQTVESKM